jgi:hypothetical protein
MLSSLGAWALIFNAVFAWATLSERLHLMEVLAIGGIIAGVVMVIATTPVGHGFAPDGSMDQIAGPLFQARFLMLSTAIISFLFCFRFTAGNKWPDLVPFCWTICSSIAGAYTVTLFKCVSTSMLDGSTAHPWCDVRFYAVIAVAIFLCISQIHLLNMALNLGRANFIVPIAFAFNLLSQIAIGEAAYHEMGVFLPLQALCYTGGIVLILCCVVLCVRAKMAAEALESEMFGTSSEKEDSPLLPERPLSVTSAKTMPARNAYGFSFDETDPFLLRGRSMSLDAPGATSMDCDAFPESFRGLRGRKYTVAFAGPLALA